MNDDELHRAAYVLACVCLACGELPGNCVCPEGCHLPGGIRPHPHRVHCCLCETPTHEFVRWPVGDSYSFGPLCLECRNSRPHGFRSMGLNNPNIPAIIAGKMRGDE